jgi:hypothetical protein
VPVSGASHSVGWRAGVYQNAAVSLAIPGDWILKNVGHDGDYDEDRAVGEGHPHGAADIVTG